MSKLKLLMKKVTDVFNRSAKSLVEEVENTAKTVEVRINKRQELVCTTWPVESDNPKDNEVERLTRLMNKTKSSRIKKKLQKRITNYGK